MSSNKKLHVRNKVPSDNPEYSIIQHLSGPVKVRLIEFCSISVCVRDLCKHNTTLSTYKNLDKVTFLADLFCFLFRKSIRFTNFDVPPPTCCLMVLPPKVSGTWCTVHGTLHHAKVRWSSLTWPITAPPVLLVKSHFFMEAMVDLIQRPMYILA